MKTVKQYETLVRTALRTANRYNRALEIQIHTLASALRTLDIATAEIDTLEVVTIQESKGRTVAHPAFKIQRDAQDSVTRQMKALGLTVGDLDGGDDNDPLIALTEKVAKADSKKQPTIVKPDEEDGD